MSTEAAISISSISKEFKTDFWKKKIRVLHDVSFEVQKGSTFGLIGPNGAGKTTAIKILLGLIKPDCGNIQVFGKKIAAQKMRSMIGYLPEQAYYYDYLYPDEILDFYGRLLGLSPSLRKERAKELLELVGLQHRKNRKLRYFSKGMLQRIGIAQALMNDPELIILDEPMSGLDPIGRKEVKDIILALQERGKTILFASHILHDVETLCDHVAILVDGKLRAVGSMNELVNPEITSTELIIGGKGYDEFDFASLQDVQAREIGDRVVVECSSIHATDEVMRVVSEKNFQLISMTPHKETLEDLFVEKVRT